MLPVLRLLRSLIAWLCVVAVLGVVAISHDTRPANAVGADDTIMGPSRVSPQQMAAWFRARTRSPYNATVSLDQLTALYVWEGSLAGVRGDIAFAQSVLETGWFSFPAGGYVAPTDNNFGGIGAYGDGSHLFRAPDAQTGVRGQMQLLRRYADPNSRSWNIGAPPVSQLWSSPASYDAMNRTHGWAPTWQSLSGTWASSTTYAYSINLLYNSMWSFAGRPGVRAWSGWEPLGGVVGSGTGVASWAANRLDVFAKAPDGTLLHEWFDGITWSGWENLGGMLVGDPVAVSWAPNRIDVFATGVDGGLRHRWWDGVQWAGWENLGGQLSSGPAVASWAANRLDVFARGTDNQLWHKWWTGTVWSGWENLGGALVGNPAAVSWGPNRIDIFARGTDDQLYHRLFDATHWSGWEPLGGVLASGPAVASWVANRLDVFVNGTDTQLWHKWWDGTAWRGYEPLGGVLTSAPGAVSWAANQIDVFVRGTDNQLWHQHWS